MWVGWNLSQTIRYEMPELQQCATQSFGCLPNNFLRSFCYCNVNVIVVFVSCQNIYKK